MSESECWITKFSFILTLKGTRELHMYIVESVLSRQLSTAWVDNGPGCDMAGEEIEVDERRRKCLCTNNFDKQASTIKLNMTKFTLRR